MNRVRKAGGWAIAIAAIAGFGTSMFQYFTSQDGAHANVAATIATTNDLRWMAHDREHDRLHFDNVRIISDIRDALTLIENLKIAIASVRKQADLHDKGYNRAAEREAAKADALLVPKESRPNAKFQSMRRKISDLVIEIAPGDVQKKAKELYKKGNE